MRATATDEMACIDAIFRSSDLSVPVLLRQAVRGSHSACFGAPGRAVEMSKPKISKRTHNVLLTV